MRIYFRNFAEIISKIMTQDLNEQELGRRQSLAKMRELGIEPYPAAMYPVNATAESIKKEYDPERAT